MMKPATLTSIFIFSFCMMAFPQIGDLINSKSFNWVIWEVKKDDEDRKNFLDSANIPFDGKMEDYKIIDIDGNGIPDILYAGSEKTTLYHNSNTPTGFTKIFEVNESLVNISRNKPWRPISLLTKDTNCCDGNNYIIRNYIPGFVEGTLTYVSENDIFINNKLDLIHENLPPFKFRIEAVPELRASADSVTTSHIIKMYQVGDYGYALASKQGRGKRTWWLVLVQEEPHRFRAGWMRSRYLKKIFR